MKAPTTGAGAGSQVGVVFASDSDRPAVDRGVRAAESRHARLTIAVPIMEPSAWAYLSPFPVDWLNAELEEDADRNARRALRQVPRDLP